MRHIMGAGLLCRPKAKKNRSGENFQVHTTDFLFAKTSVRFCLFLANDSNEHSQLNTIKCDYNGHTLATVHSVVCKVEGILKGRLNLIPSPSPSLKIQTMGGKVCLRFLCTTSQIIGGDFANFVAFSEYT